MFFSVSVFARRSAFAAAGILLATAIAGCQGAQSAPTAQPTPAASTNQSTGQVFGGQLPAELPQDPAAGFGSVEIIQGTTITLTAGRGGFAAGQAPGGQAQAARLPGRAPKMGRASKARVASPRAARSSGANCREGRVRHFLAPVVRPW